MLGVKRFSSLPNMQSDGGDLARQGQACQRWLHALGQACFIELAERAGDSTGGGGGALEQILQLVVVVEVQPADEPRLLAAHQLSILETIVGAAARLQPQAAVGPELAFGA